MVANCSSVETCAQDTTGVVECDLTPLEEHLPIVCSMTPDTSSNTLRSLKTVRLMLSLQPYIRHQPHFLLLFPSHAGSPLRKPGLFQPC